MAKAIDMSQARYPNSVSLFLFCRHVLDHKFGGIRVIDQDIGQILGFDPADCSHWKKGKKNIRSIHAMRSIADHLGVEHKLVTDVAFGEVDHFEAFHEYRGYGLFEADEKIVETARKDFYRKNSHQWSKDKEIEIRKFFEIDHSHIQNSVFNIHRKVNFTECPLYLPEILNAFPDITFKADKKLLLSQEQPIQYHISGGKIQISHPEKFEMKPYLRFKVAKALGYFFLGDLPGKVFAADQSLEHYMHYVNDIRTNVFAVNLLLPKPLVFAEIAKLGGSKDLVTQLAEVFWVSRSLMNQRLIQLMSSLPLDA